MNTHTRFPIDQIDLKSIELRGHSLKSNQCVSLTDEFETFASDEIRNLTKAILTARHNGRPVILMMGGHLIKLGLSRFIIDLIEQDLITHVASNGAAIIHDYELSTIGGTSEDVEKWLSAGQFGLWKETGRINNLIQEAAQNNEGLGEAIGRTIEHENAPYKNLSILAACWRKKIPFTAHVTIGGDIIHAHANCDGSALGKASFEDFLIFANSVLSLEGGVFLNVGSAVTGPEVFLKALSMARNVVHQRQGAVSSFTTAVFDLVDLGDEWGSRPPEKSHPQYYYRPLKTILHRTVKDGGESHYVSGDLSRTIPELWTSLLRPDSRTSKSEIGDEHESKLSVPFECWNNGEKISTTNAASILKSWRAKETSISFTNGCFDILHAGHISLLRKAKSLGDILVVGINSDSSIKRLKGIHRPANRQSDRCAVLSSISFVDLVFLFHEDSPEMLIQAISPLYLVKGDEYEESEIPGADFVKSQNGKVVRVKMIPGRSTTSTIALIQNGRQPEG